MESEIVEKDTKDIKGWIIPKGTRIFIKKEARIKNPRTNKEELFRVVLIDNGTGIKRLCPETCIKTEVG